MKRLLSLLSAVLLMLSLCACGKTNAPTASPTPTAAPAASAETPAPASAPPTAEPTPAPTAEPTPHLTPSPTVPPTYSETLEVNRGSRTVTYSAAMTELELHTGVSCAVLLPAEVMTAEFAGNAWRLTETEHSEEGFLEFSFIAGTTAEELLPGLMDGYLSFTDIEFSDVTAFDRKSVGHVSASDGNLLAEGWVLDAEGGAIALVQVCRLSELGDLGNLFTAVLESFAMVVG